MQDAESARRARQHISRALLGAMLIAIGGDGIERTLGESIDPGIEARPEPPKPAAPKHNAREALVLDEDEAKRLNAAWGGVRPSKADMPIEPYYRDRHGSLRRVFTKK